MKRIWALLISVILLSKPAYALNDTSPSNWAKSDVERAIALGFVPSDLRTDYQSFITRTEFTEVALYYLASQYNYDLRRDPDSGPYDFVTAYFNNHKPDRNGEKLEYRDPYEVTLPFLDVDSSTPYYYEISTAYTLGLIDGRSEEEFDPDGFITRQEAATLLMNCYQNYGGEFVENADTSAFLDQDFIGEWALPSVISLAAFGVLEGDETNHYNPTDFFTREQAFITFYRLYTKAPVSWINSNITPIMPYEEQIEELIDSEWWHLYDEVRYETPDCTILYGNLAHRHSSGGDYVLYIVYKAGGYFNAADSLPSNVWGNNIHELENIYLSDDKLKIYFSVSFDDVSYVDYEVDILSGKVSLAQT